MNSILRILTILLTAFLLFPTPAAASAGSGTSPLTKEIEGKRHQLEVLEAALALDNRHLHQDLNAPENIPANLEEQYRQLLVLLNISIAGPYEERMLYNQLFQLESNVKSLLTRYNSYNATISSDLEVIENSKVSLRILLKKNENPHTLKTTRQFIAKLDKLTAQLQSTALLIKPRLFELKALNAEMAEDLKIFSKEVPDLLMAYMIHLKFSALNPDNLDRLLLAPSFWRLGQPAQSLAKIPDTYREWAYTLVTPLIFLFLVFLWKRKYLGKLSARYFTDNSRALRAFRHILILAPIAFGLMIGSQWIEYPSGVLPMQTGLILALLTALKAAWCLRTVRMGEMPPSPLFPLFLVFVVGVVAQFLHTPLMIMAVGWPLVLLIATAALLYIRKRPYPPLERRLIKASLLICGLLCLMCLEGHAYMSTLLTMWWLLAALVIQLGSALGSLLKDTSDTLFGHEETRLQGILLSLCIPVVWTLLTAAIVAWTVSQFGEIRMLYRIMGTPSMLSSLIILMLTVLSIRLLTSLDAAYSTHSSSGKRPLKGFLQVAKIFVLLLGLGTAACLAMERSPWAVLGGVGAVAAALLFVFKDTILSLVAGVRIVVDDLVRIDDWIEIRDMGVDGDVIEVTLYSIKIRNFDRTIVTIPTITLIEHSFKNWRGMQESGGRRIKRSIPIDLTSVFFLDEKWTERLQKISLLTDWFEKNSVDRLSPRPNLDPTSPDLLNSDNLTNLGAFRAYVDAWLRGHDKVHQGLTFIVRHLDPVADEGLPFQIYVFANDTNWAHYEGIQADIFDHLIATLPVFGLRAYQRNALPDRRPSAEMPVRAAD